MITQNARTQQGVPLRNSHTPYVRIVRSGLSTMHSAAVISTGRHRRYPTWHEQLNARIIHAIRRLPSLVAPASGASRAVAAGHGRARDG
eukprot:5483708-Pyramimonas_sp.AAC.1